MSKVLLISTNQCTTPEAVFPLGLAYLSGALRQAGQDCAWIIGDTAPGYQKLVTRLRQRGIAGPLWSYFSMVQQIRPAELGRS